MASASRRDEPLRVLAGDLALAAIRRDGLDLDAVESLVGASGGPKWLVLVGLDKALFGELLSSREPRPLDAIGSSIGAWRHACLGQSDPLAALARFEEAYVTQAYPPKPPPSLVAERSRQIRDTLLGAEGARQIAAHPWLRTHVLTTRLRAVPGARDGRVQAAALVLGGLGNVARRSALGLLFERVVVTNAPASPLLRGLDDLPTRLVELDEVTLPEALMATASIPFVIEPQGEIAGGPPGPYLDGGVLDYHPALDFSRSGGLALYPHFFDRITPGWFDKRIPGRWPRREWMSRVVLLAPSPRFVASLPGGAIPDRNDFFDRGDEARIRRWREVARRSVELGDAFLELLRSGRIAEVAVPMPGRRIGLRPQPK